MSENGKLVPTDMEKFIIPEEDRQLKADLDYIRQNIKDLIETGKTGLDELVLIAKASQHPRSFEVLSTYMKQLTEMNRHLAEVGKDKVATVKKEGRPADTTEGSVQNNLFVGSPADLGRVLDAMKKTNGSKPPKF